MSRPPPHCPAQQLRLLVCDVAVAGEAGKRKRSEGVRIKGVTRCKGMAEVLTRRGIATTLIAEEQFKRELMTLFLNRGLCDDYYNDSQQFPKQWAVYREYSSGHYDDRLVLLRIYREEDPLGQITLCSTGDSPHTLRSWDDARSTPFTADDLAQLETQPWKVQGIVMFERGLGSFVLETLFRSLYEGDRKYRISINPHPENKVWIAKLKEESLRHPEWLYYKTSFKLRHYIPFHLHF